MIDYGEVSDREDSGDVEGYELKAALYEREENSRINGAHHKDYTIPQNHLTRPDHNHPKRKEKEVVRRTRRPKRAHPS